MAIHQGRCIPIEGTNKQALIEQEADMLMPPYRFQGHSFTLTIKDHCVIPSAGIDESNADGHYILRPEDIQKSSKEIWEYLREKHHLENLGIIITDSVTQPLRRGTHGKAI